MSLCLNFRRFFYQYKLFKRKKKDFTRKKINGYIIIYADKVNVCKHFRGWKFSGFSIWKGLERKIDLFIYA